MGCTSSKRQSEAMNETRDCCRNWNYKFDLEEDIELKVLLHYSMDTLGRTPYSNLIIGRHKEDTIAVIDDQFKGNLERGRIVNVKSIKWNYGKINESAPCMIIPNEKKEQQIFCGVSAVYYAELKSD